MWTGHPMAARDENPNDVFYGIGFVIGEPMTKCAFCKERDLHLVAHSGAAVGASSMLLMSLPPKRNDQCVKRDESPEIQGIVVAMITNLTGVSLSKTAEEITNLFRPFL